MTVVKRTNRCATVAFGCDAIDARETTDGDANANASGLGQIVDARNEMRGEDAGRDGDAVMRVG